MVVYTWWCWYIYKEVFGVEVDQLGEEIEAKQLMELTGRWSCASSQ
jgi:hypothetical protein